jgi:hypothetical protein
LERALGAGAADEARPRAIEGGGAFDARPRELGCSLTGRGEPEARLRATARSEREPKPE